MSLSGMLLSKRYLQVQPELKPRKVPKKRRWINEEGKFTILAMMTLKQRRSINLDLNF